MKKVVNVNEWLETRQNEAYDGNMADFKYSLELAVEEIGHSTKAIKKVSKVGKRFEVRMSSYMSQRATWEQIGELMGATLVEFTPDRSIAVGLYESVEVNEARSINKIQKDYAAAVSQMAEVVVSWKEAKASGDAKAEAGFLGQLKDLTVKKKGFERELDAFVMGKDKDAELAGVLEALLTEAKFKAGQVWVFKHVDGDKNVEIIEIKSNGDIVAKEDGKSDKFIVRDANKFLKKEVTESIDEAVSVPSNVLAFAKQKGSYATSLVKKAATWAEKSGKRISGGTAIGKNYMTIILDMKYQGSEIYINLNNETIELFGEEVTDAKSFAKVLSTNESVVTESHFKVGDKVKMSHGGTGVIVSLDKEDGTEDEKYYNVKLPNGDMHKHAPNELTKESLVTEAMSFEELKNKYIKNPYGIGAQIVVFEPAVRSNPAYLVFKHDERYSRDKIEGKLKELGFAAKKMSKSTADKSFKYRYELILTESLVTEAKVNMAQLVDILANLEDSYTEEEFVEVGQDINVNADTMAKIFNGYWEVDAKSRFQWGDKDWAKWLKANYEVK